MKKFLMAASAGAALAAAVGSANANVLLYSFESTDSPNSVDGFAKNGAGSTVSQSTIGVTNGSNSLLLNVTGAGFVSDLTASIPSVLTNPSVTAITQDITVPSTFSYTGGYADLGITLYVYNPADPNNGGAAESGQFQVDPGDERAIPFTTPGTTTNVTIPLTGADPDTGTDESYAALLAEGWVPTGFEYFFDKNAPIQLAIDNVQAVGVSVPEPTSLGLLGLAGGFFMKRRSR